MLYGYVPELLEPHHIYGLYRGFLIKDQGET